MQKNANNEVNRATTVEQVEEIKIRCYQAKNLEEAELENAKEVIDEVKKWTIPNRPHWDEKDIHTKVPRADIKDMDKDQKKRALSKDVYHKELKYGLRFYKLEPSSGDEFFPRNSNSASMFGNVIFADKDGYAVEQSFSFDLRNGIYKTQIRDWVNKIRISANGITHVVPDSEKAKIRAAIMKEAEKAAKLYEAEHKSDGENKHVYENDANRKIDDKKKIKNISFVGGATMNGVNISGIKCEVDGKEYTIPLKSGYTNVVQNAIDGFVREHHLSDKEAKRLQYMIDKYRKAETEKYWDMQYKAQGRHEYAPKHKIQKRGK